MILSAGVFEEVLRKLKTDRGSDEQRVTARVGIRARITVMAMHGGIPDRAIQAWSRDLSVSGIGLLHHEPWEPGSRFLLVLDQDHGKPMHITCEVVRRDTVDRGLYVLGARFVSADNKPADAPPPTGTELPAQQPTGI